MKCILPIAITDDIVLYSSLTETEATEYSATTTYGTGQKCLVNHVIYTSKVDGNVGNYPPTDISLTSPHWIEGSCTNKWAMFDKYMNTDSSSSGGLDLVFTLKSNYCNAIALFNLAGSDVIIDVKNSSGVSVFNKALTLLATEVSNWEEYFFSQRYFANTLWVDFPLKSASTITVRVKGATPALGKVVLGEAKWLGDSKYDGKISKTDYSVYSTDSFGQVYLSRGNYAKNYQGDVYVRSDRMIEVDTAIEQIRATITAFACANGEDAYDLYRSMIVCGYLKSFDVSIPRLSVLECTVEITGTA